MRKTDEDSVSHTAEIRIIGDDEHAGGLPFIEIGSGVLPSPQFRSICEVPCTVPDEGEFVLTDEDREVARRLVAAWNACKRIETETLEKGVISKTEHELSCVRGNEIRQGVVQKLDTAEFRADAAEARLQKIAGIVEGVEARVRDARRCGAATYTAQAITMAELSKICEAAALDRPVVDSLLEETRKPQPERKP